MSHKITLLELLLKRDGYALEYRGKPVEIYAPCMGKPCLKARMEGKQELHTFKIEPKRGGVGKCVKCGFNFSCLDYLLVSPRDAIGAYDAKMLISSEKKAHKRYINRTTRIYGFSVLQPDTKVDENLESG